MIPEGDQTPRQGPMRARERDLLAERRARRAGAGDPELLRRAEAAEVRVDALESHLVDLRRRLAQAVRERERTAELLVEHERELRLVQQREYAEQQLRVEAEDNLTGLRRAHRAELDRLHRRVQEASAAERRAEEQRAAAEQRRAALAARLASVQESSVRLEHSVTALQDAATALRTALGREQEAARARIAELERALRSAGRSQPEQAERQTQRRDEMAAALAAAVERLRARVAAVGELQETPTDLPSPPPADAPAAPQAPVVLVPRLLGAPTRREPWLADAIRRVAERRDSRLAGELIAELLPAQRLVVDRPLAYRLRIAELGDPLLVRLSDGEAAVRRLAAGGPRAAAASNLSPAQGVDFALEGRAADLAELAAGGTRRRLPGVRVRGARRRARSLRRARRAPLALWDLAAAGIDVWPGLLLLALAEAIAPSWTAGKRFTAAFAIAGPANATLYVGVRDGEPLAVTRTHGEEPAVTASLSERAFMCMLAGAPLPTGERIVVEGDPGALELLIGWIDRAQGLGR